MKGCCSCSERDDCDDSLARVVFVVEELLQASKVRTLTKCEINKLREIAHVGRNARAPNSRGARAASRLRRAGSRVLPGGESGAFPIARCNLQRPVEQDGESLWRRPIVIRAGGRPVRFRLPPPPKRLTHYEQSTGQTCCAPPADRPTGWSGRLLSLAAEQCWLELLTPNHIPRTCPASAHT